MKHYRFDRRARNRGAGRFHGVLLLAILLVGMLTFGLVLAGCSSAAEGSSPEGADGNPGSSSMPLVPGGNSAGSGSETTTGVSGGGFAMNGSTSGMVPYPPKRTFSPPTTSRKDEFENLAARIEVLNVSVGNATGGDSLGAWLMVKMRNRAGRPIREVRAQVTLTDEAGNPKPIAPLEVWLYASHAPIPSGAASSVRVSLQAEPLPAGTKARVSVVLATEGLSVR